MVIGLLGILKAGRRLSAARPGLSGGAAGVHAGGRRRPVLVTQQALLERLPELARGARRAPALVRLDADWGAIAAQPATRRRCASSPASPPTSSTPQAQPEPQRAWWCSHGGLQQSRCRWSTDSISGRTGVRRCSVYADELRRFGRRRCFCALDRAAGPARRCRATLRLRRRSAGSSCCDMDNELRTLVHSSAVCICWRPSCDECRTTLSLMHVALAR